MDWITSLRAFGIGLLVGAVCVGGLQLGIRILLKIQEKEALTRGQRNFRYALSGTILIGQLFLALGILYKSGVDSKNALVLGAGLVTGTFLVSLLFQRKDEA